MKGPTKITSQKLLFVEGKDEIEFFKWFLNSIEILDVQIEEVGGDVQFNTKFPNFLKIPGFDDVKVLGFIRDADDNAETRFESIRQLLIRIKFNPPIEKNLFTGIDSKHLLNIGIFLMPGSSTGKLETLVLNSVSNNPAMLYVNQFEKSYLTLKNPPKDREKAKTQSFLATMPEIANSIGTASKKGYWDINSPVFNQLKVFLNNFK